MVKYTIKSIRSLPRKTSHTDIKMAWRQFWWSNRIPCLGDLCMERSWGMSWMICWLKWSKLLTITLSSYVREVARIGFFYWITQVFIQGRKEVGHMPYLDICYYSFIFYPHIVCTLLDIRNKTRHLMFSFCLFTFYLHITT